MAVTCADLADIIGFGKRSLARFQEGEQGTDTGWTARAVKRVQSDEV